MYYLCSGFQISTEIMARPIAETPILYGDVGRRFEARMNETRCESAAERADRIAAYNLISSLVVD